MRIMRKGKRLGALVLALSLLFTTLLSVNTIAQAGDLDDIKFEFHCQYDENMGTVYISYAGQEKIDVNSWSGGDYVKEIPMGTEVTLTAEPKNKWRFCRLYALSC